MEYTLEHMAKGRVRIRMKSSALSFDQADCIEYYLKRLPFVTSVKTYLRTGGVAITYLGNINSLLKSWMILVMRMSLFLRGLESILQENSTKNTKKN